MRGDTTFLGQNDLLLDFFDEPANELSVLGSRNRGYYLGLMKITSAR